MVIITSAPASCSGVTFGTDGAGASDDAMPFQVHVNLVSSHSLLHVPSTARPAQEPQRGVLKEHHASARYPCGITVYYIIAWKGYT